MIGGDIAIGAVGGGGLTHRGGGTDGQEVRHILIGANLKGQKPHVIRRRLAVFDGGFLEGGSVDTFPGHCDFFI